MPDEIIPTVEQDSQVSADLESVEELFKTREAPSSSSTDGVEPPEADSSDEEDNDTGLLEGLPEDEPEVEFDGPPAGDADTDGADAGTETPDADPVVLDSDGLKLTKSQVVAYAQFEQTLLENPGLVDHINKFFSQPPGAGDSTVTAPSATSPAPAVQEFKLPEGYEDEPAVQMLFAEVKALRDNNAALTQAQLRADAERANQSLNESQALVTRASADFQAAKKLTDSEMQRIQKAASRLDILPSLMAGVDPISGLAAPTDALSALTKAYDMVYWQIDDFRQREIAAKLPAKKAQAQRKANASALSSTGGSSPRVSNKKPSTQADIREAMIKEVAASMFNNAN